MADNSSSNSSGSSSDSEEEERGPPSKKPRTTAAVASAPLEVAPSNAVHEHQKNRSHHPIIVILDQATVETVKNKRGVFELLNCDDHREICRRKLHKDPNVFRPDILHQEMLSLLDSPLNKAGLLKIYIQTNKGVLIDVHPSLRIPRTYKRFAGLMVQLLHKMKIKAGSDSTTLLKVIKNPVAQYLPAGTRCYGLSCDGTLYRPMALAKTLLSDEPSATRALAVVNSGSNANNPPGPGANSPPTCFVIGAMSTGHVRIDDHPYIEKMLSVSEYPLSGAAAISRLLGGIEEHWGIV